MLILELFIENDTSIRDSSLLHITEILPQTLIGAFRFERFLASMVSSPDAREKPPILS